MTDTPAGDWTPDQKLRAEASDQQINARRSWHVRQDHPNGWNMTDYAHASTRVARELADAMSEARVEEALVAAHARVAEVTLHNRDACGYNCDCHDELTDDAVWREAKSSSPRASSSPEPHPDTVLLAKFDALVRGAEYGLDVAHIVDDRDEDTRPYYISYGERVSVLGRGHTLAEAIDNATTPTSLSPRAPESSLTNDGRPDGIDADGVLTIAGSEMLRRIRDGHMEYNMLNFAGDGREWVRQIDVKWADAEVWRELAERARRDLAEAQAHVTLIEWAATPPSTEPR